MLATNFTVPDKAVYCYPFGHYVNWLAGRPSEKTLLVPGGFGENLTTRGLDEDLMCIGDGAVGDYGRQRGSD